MLMKKRKRIALLTSQIEERYQSGFLEGFQERTYELDYDVCVFSGFRRTPDSSKKEVGEANIYSLINFDLFDAVVIMPNLLHISGLVRRIEKKLKTKYKGKVLYVDRGSDTYPYITMNHYSMFYKTVEHLIEQHHCKDIRLISGPKWHPHYKQRQKAYLDCMNSHSLEVSADSIIYGNFWFDSGEKIAEDFILNEKKLPDAFACANDYMAIGIVDTLKKYGVKVPEDVLVTGYDSSDIGHHFEVPISSIDLPSKEYGIYAADCVKCLFEGKTIKEFKGQSDMYIGHSCGCNEKNLLDVDEQRQILNNISKQNMFLAGINSMMEDIVLQTSFKSLMDCIRTYSYQIREFELFRLCLNDVWVRDNNIDKKIKGKVYSDKMIPILTCRKSENGADVLDFCGRFKTKDMLPELHIPNDKPRTYIFSPLYFDDLTFGYSVVCYGDEAKAYNTAYYMWMRSVMTGLENYRRGIKLFMERKSAEAEKMHDKLTGMYNYEGFVKHSKPMIERASAMKANVAVLAMDIACLEAINTKFGRREGNVAIHDFAKVVLECSDENSLTCRLGNDELIISKIVSDDEKDAVEDLQKMICDKLKILNKLPGRKYKINAYFGSSANLVNNLSEMEDLVNWAVSKKNGYKANEKRVFDSTHLTLEESAKVQLVKKILDENLFTYCFQPIVSAHDGTIYSYEALMRAGIEPKISPLEIIKYAGYLGRLIDIEKATFFNVLNYVRENQSEFSGKKIFINSIPSEQFERKDELKIRNLLNLFEKQIVVELTEQAEIADDRLSEMKRKFEKLGIETAVDDYGTGYSNIVNLLRYMPNYVKIDRMLLSNIQDNPQKQHFVKDTVLFAHDNNFLVLAEGIESSEELKVVIELGVDLLQGYYMARPTPNIVKQIPDKVVNEIKKYSSEIL